MLSKDTELFTPWGWRSIRDIYPGDNVMGLDVYPKFLTVIQKEVAKGDAVNIKGSRLNISVHPETTIIIVNRLNNQKYFSQKKAFQIVDKKIVVPNRVVIPDYFQDYFITSPLYKLSERKIELMGCIYVYGTLSEDGIDVDENPGLSLVEKNNLKYSHIGDKIRIKNWQLTDFYAAYLQDGLSPDITRAPKWFLKHFLSGMLAKATVYNTYRSITLQDEKKIDAIQSVAMLCGFSTTIQASSNIQDTDGAPGACNMFTLIINEMPRYLRGVVEYANTQEEFYDITVSNHVLLVRRDKCIAWVGGRGSASILYDI